MKNEALKALDYLYTNCLDYGNKDKHYDLIEIALKRLENYEQNEDFDKDVLNYAFLNEQDKIKKLKALEIIKKKQVAVDEFIQSLQTSNPLQEYNDFAREENNLTQEEFDLLKEVFK